MTFRALEIFLAVADEKSFGKAAQKLFISQPSVTQQIKKIENELGFALFLRDKHNVELTKAGEIVQEAAHSILDTYHEAILKSMRCSATHETLSIGYVGQMNIHLLPEIMESFQECLSSMIFRPPDSFHIRLPIPWNTEYSVWS